VPAPSARKRPVSEDQFPAVRQAVLGAHPDVSGRRIRGKPEDVNPYAASTFFAVDRFASYATVWRDDYKRGGLILTDRYTTSNALHQGAKLPARERTGFFKWLYTFEFELMELPSRMSSCIWIYRPSCA
jgi:hypothetical protein